MSKFNEKKTIRAEAENHPLARSNAEGGLSYAMTPKIDLYTRVATSLMGENTFYQDAQQRDGDLIKLIHQVAATDPEFLLKLAIYAREKLYLRSVTTVLLAEYANSVGVGLPRSRKLVSRCIQRPDDMTELISYQLNRNGSSPRKGKLPMVIKNGIRDAFPKFDAYQLGKYNRPGSVKLRDAYFMTHPKPTSEAQYATWNDLVTGTLEPPMTWEVMRSTGKMGWHEVINDVFHKGGRTNNLMAIIRNLRNCVTAKDVTRDDINLLAEMIQDKEAIKKSKILPFRAFSAYVELQKTHLEGKDIAVIYEALEEMTRTSIDNVPRLPGLSVIAIDVSGSMMWTKVSRMSDVYPAQLAILLGMMSRRICDDAMTCLFDSTLTWVNLRDRSILNSAYTTRPRGWSTYGHLVVQDLIKRDIVADRVIFLTDMMLYDSSIYGQSRSSLSIEWLKYVRSVAPKCKLYNWNLMSYGEVSVAEDMQGSRAIGGWSDRSLEMIGLLERGANVIDEIKSIA
ncbi:MAG: TROVE domain-containing protein [Dehalococcoidia bacterium]|nr:TROVE domain-containing protein [Dehalococcoidia bacterium]